MTRFKTNTFVLLKCCGNRLFFLTIPKPPCPLVPYVAGGSNSTRFFKKRLSIPLIHLCRMCSRGVLSRSLRCLGVWSFQRLSSGGIPAPSAFSREKHAGAAVSPTAKSLKLQSHSANIVPRGSKPSEHLHFLNSSSCPGKLLDTEIK